MIAEIALLWAALVLVPVALRRAWLVAPAALLTASFAFPIGPVAAALASPWLAATAFMALRSRRSLLDFLPLAYLTVGAASAVQSRAGVLLGFPSIIVLLTAVHYHYAGFVLPLLAREVSRAALVAVLVAMPLVAIGITWLPLVEWLAAWLLGLAAIVVAVLQVRVRGPGRVLRIASSACLAVAMALAGVYALSEFLGRNWIDIQWMLRTHGLLNAGGFATLGLLSAVRRDAAASPRSLPAAPAA